MYLLDESDLTESVPSHFCRFSFPFFFGHFLVFKKCTYWTNLIWPKMSPPPHFCRFSFPFFFWSLFTAFFFESFWGVSQKLNYWGDKGSWTKVQKNGLFLFTLNPSVKNHRQNFKKRFFNNDAKNRKIKKQEL